MSKRRWTIRLGPPIALVAAATLLAGVAVGCYGARPTETPGVSSDASLEASGPPGSVPPASAAPRTAAVASDRPGRSPQSARDLVGRTWLAEGPTGWEAGQVGGRRIALADHEVGVAAGGRWIISAVLRPTSAIQLLLRDGPSGDPRVIGLGSLAPTATAIVGDRAYVSGFSFATPNDPGILEIDLELATARSVLAPSALVGTRYLAASPDGSTLVSSLCDVASDPEPETCLVTVLSLEDGTAKDLGAAPGGLLRAASPEVAILAPHGPEAPAWLAGLDLGTGRELWRLAGGEFGPSVMDARHGLIQQRTLIDGPAPGLRIEAIDVRSGATRLLYEEDEEAGAALRSLWPALCSAGLVALGEDATGSRALGAGAEARTRVRLVPIDGGAPLDVAVSLGAVQ